MPPKASIYAGKDPAYYGTPRADFLAWLPAGGSRVLEVGCGTGATLAAAKAQGKAAETVGVEMQPLTPAPGVDRFLSGDVEELELPYPPGYFDAVLCGEVLEHLIDPWAVVRKLVGLLKPGGLFLCSLPNLRHYRAWGRIVWRGRVGYEEQGVFDRTHLRFFCKRDMKEMLEQAGLRVEQMLGAWPTWQGYLNHATFGLIEQFLAVQYVIVARKQLTG